jgi:flavorubredoxin
LPDGKPNYKPLIREEQMSKVLVGYVSRTGKTEKMAEYIAEGIRFTGNTAELQKISGIKSEKDLAGYDGFIFGCPTYHRDMTAGMKTFLFLAQKANLIGKMGGAFGSYTHSGESAPMIYDTMEHVYKMDMLDLGALSLKEAIVDSQEGLKACQDYGRALGEKF